MTYYRISLAQIDYGDSFQFLQGMTFGTQSCDVVFTWDDTIQEQYNEYNTSVVIAAENDPLIDTDGKLNRSYNYLDYYLSIDKNHIKEWLLNPPAEFPTSLKGVSIDTQETMVAERILLCENISQILSQYDDILQWYLTITYKGETFQGKLLPGAIFRNNENTFTLEVISDRAKVGRNDLAYVTFRIGIE